MACFQNQLLSFAKQKTLLFVSCTKLKTENAETSPEKKTDASRIWRNEKQKSKYNSTTSIVKIAIIENIPKQSDSRLTVNLLLYKKQRKWISAYLVSFLRSETPANHWLGNAQLIDWCCFFYSIRNSLVTLLEVIIHVRQLYWVSYIVWFYDTCKLTYFSSGNQETVPDRCLPIYSSGHDSEYKYSTMFVLACILGQVPKIQTFWLPPLAIVPLDRQGTMQPGCLSKQNQITQKRDHLEVENNLPPGTYFGFLCLALIVAFFLGCWKLNQFLQTQEIVLDCCSPTYSGRLAIVFLG